MNRRWRIWKIWSVDWTRYSEGGDGLCPFKRVVEAKGRGFCKARRKMERWMYLEEKAARIEAGELEENTENE